MKKVNLNGKMLTLDGETVKNQDGTESQMNEVVANMLVKSKSDSAIRKLTIAQAIYLNGEMDLEDADYKLVKKCVEESGTAALVVAQILKAMGEKE